MTQTPPPRPAGRRKTLGFVIGGLVLVVAVAIAFFADQVPGPAGRGMAPPAPVANPAEPAPPAADPAPAN